MAGSVIKGLTFDEALDVALTQRQINLSQGRSARKISRAEVEAGFLEAFELVGGITRLAIWANNEKNYGEFLKMYSRLLPKEVEEKVKETFVYVSNVPPSPLNKEPVVTKIDGDVVDG